MFSVIENYLYPCDWEGNWNGTFSLFDYTLHTPAISWLIPSVSLLYYMLQLFYKVCPYIGME